MSILNPKSVLVVPHYNSRITFFNEANDTDCCLGCRGDCDCDKCIKTIQKAKAKQARRNHLDENCEES